MDGKSQTPAGEIEEVEQRWHAGEKGSRILVEVATAYAITKVLLPVRIIFSVWATPWTARVFFSRAFGMGKKSKAVPKAPAIKKDVGKDTKAP